MDKATLTEIGAEFLNSEGWRKTSPLDYAKVHAWMESQDLEVLGAVHCLLFGKENFDRVTPPLSLAEVVRFRRHYYERCLREYSIEDSWEEEGWVWADWGFNATHGVVFWFYDLWKDKEVSRSVLIELKQWLAQLLKQRVQEGLLATAVYDHLLKHKKIAKFFADWRNDPELCSILHWETS